HLGLDRRDPEGRQRAGILTRAGPPSRLAPRALRLGGALAAPGGEGLLLQLLTATPRRGACRSPTPWRSCSAPSARRSRRSAAPWWPRPTGCRSPTPSPSAPIRPS